MGAILGVGQGSEQKSLLATMQWQGGPSSMAPLAFVGKGVCFDTGGITLKPGTGMESMIWDMAGAAAVAGAMHVLAGRKANVTAVGVLGLVENMPDGNAQRPGDIVKSMSGQTIEIISTDAEGRLVLADALWYCQDRFKPSIMIDLATLTGASKVALGPEFAALFSNSDELADHLVSASNVSGDRLWRLPLSAKMEESLVSTSADMKNFSDNTGSAITGALFLQKFVNQSTWAHIDMTPTAWFNKSCSPTIPDGASGYGVRLLDQFVSDFFES
jgi:leucyl aminopeptidase